MRQCLVNSPGKSVFSLVTCCFPPLWIECSTLLALIGNILIRNLVMYRRELILQNRQKINHVQRITIRYSLLKFPFVSFRLPTFIWTMFTHKLSHRWWLKSMDFSRSINVWTDGSFLREESSEFRKHEKSNQWSRINHDFKKLLLFNSSSRVNGRSSSPTPTTQLCQSCQQN